MCTIAISVTVGVVALLALGLLILALSRKPRSERHPSRDKAGATSEMTGTSSDAKSEISFESMGKGTDVDGKEGKRVWKLAFGGRKA